MGKVIHSRNKSTSALSTASQMGVIKPTSKRAAFADVSNTARTAAQVKDDIILSSKAKITVLPPSLAASIKQITKSSTLLRPAQRPSSQVPAVKAPPSHPTTSAIDVSAATKSTVDRASDVQLASRKTLSRKSTAVFKETEASVQNVVETAVVNSRQPHVQEVASQKTSNLPETALVTRPSKDALKKVQLSTETEYAKDVASSLSSAISTTISETIAPPPSKTEQEENRIALDVQAGYAYLESFEHKAQITAGEHNVELKTKASALPVEEPVEYWPTEDDEEYYDADGYTTMRSFRSKGENTTGPVTLVICPRVTTRIQEELAAAKIFVDSTKSFDDIEEECWDTTMVAEYGDDIFDYMRTLEVSVAVISTSRTE